MDCYLNEMWFAWNWLGSMINHSCRACWSVPGHAVQCSCMLCRFALWLSGMDCDYAGHHCYVTLAALLQSKWLYELINSVASVYNWTGSVLGCALDISQNQCWKWFTRLTLLHCCSGLCLLIKPLPMLNSTFRFCLPFLINNADYWGTPEPSTESWAGELGCPPSCRGQHSQPGFSRDMAESPPEVFCEDNKPFFTALVLMSTRTETFPLSSALQPRLLPC